MTRSVTFELPVDTGLFTPLQLQARAAFGLAMTGWARWLREHWVPFPRLIRDHGLGVVIAGLDLEYLRPFTFFDADTLVVTVTLKVAARGNLLFLTTVVAAEGGDDVARVEAVLRPVAISDGVALSAAPTDLDAGAMARFADDEVVATGSRPRLRPLLADLETVHHPLRVSSATVTVHRHLCEAADQWSGIALPDLTTELRERVVSALIADDRTHAAALIRPLQRVTIEFSRAAFFLDEITVECRAYGPELAPFFVHRISGSRDGEPLATVLEWFSPSDDPAGDGPTHHFAEGATR